MHSLHIRPRRLRTSYNMRQLISETSLSVKDFIYPLFIVPGESVKEPIRTMPGIYRFSPDEAVKEAAKAWELGIISILVFGVPEEKDAYGTSAWDENGSVQLAVKMIKKQLPDLLVITDVCLCEYTDHGHCGVIEGDKINNDETLPLLAKTALSHAKAGADIIAPSDMMDGRVSFIREHLDQEGYENIPIMSYAAKYASAYYGPFREAVDSAPQFGDRKTYQMDYANTREALKEVFLDIEEGADLIIVKPALAYLDILSKVRENCLLPIVAYNVSGEYAMVKAAAEQGMVDEKGIVIENLTAMKRAGADAIITYHAIDAAKWLK